jgi:hypothetical protein
VLHNVLSFMLREHAFYSRAFNTRVWRKAWGARRLLVVAGVVLACGCDSTAERKGLAQLPVEVLQTILDMPALGLFPDGVYRSEVVAALQL